MTLKMPKNIAFFIVIALIGLSASIYSIRTAVEAYQFWRLDKKVPIEVLTFDVKKLAEDRFILVAHYRYQNIDEVQELSNQVYKNPYAAQSAAQKQFKEIRTIWIDSSNPFVSSLEKNISYKNLGYTLILWGLTAYFFFLKKMVIE